MLTRIKVCLLLALTCSPSLFGADIAMTVTDKEYLNTQGFSVFLYDSTYHPVFVDQKNTAMEMIFHGQRIATNGDVRLMPTPEQRDLVKGWDDALAKDCLATAIKAWNEEKAHPTLFPKSAVGGGAPESAAANGVLAASRGSAPGAAGGRNGRAHSGQGNSGAPAATGTTSAPAVPPAPPAGFGRGAFSVGQDWSAALELTIATNGGEPYRSRLKELFPRLGRIWGGD